jgi:23S rRNA (cytidine1920-2'-O)/16S rRNA (cytidine1409-2'-O)-methyltransferase
VSEKNKALGSSAHSDFSAQDFGRVSRAGQKLADANAFFGVDFRGRVVLDLGSSTGGFTEYALSRGAKKVIAVEIGTRQMDLRLRNNFRVELHEKTNLFDFVLREKVDVIVADVSFLSLRKVLIKIAKDFLGSSDVDVLVMLKPQFEAKSFQLVKGVVKNSKMRREVIKDFESWLKTNDWKIRAKHDNEVAGANGNRERFYYLVKV